MGKVEAAREELTVYLPDTRGVTISRWGRGNTKLGPDICTYSRLPGRAAGTCPGATDYCLEVCYAMRVASARAVWAVWTVNTIARASLPGSLPPWASAVRWHVGGDFDTTQYIQSWIRLAHRNPHVSFFGFTRSWRVPELLPALEALRCLKNVQLFASMDRDTPRGPPEGWRRAWLDGDVRLFDDVGSDFRRLERPWHLEMDRDLVYVCPEETGRKANCQECQYCIRGKRGDVLFLLH